MMKYLLPLSLMSCITIEGPDAQGYKWVKDGSVGKPDIHIVHDGNIYLYCGLELHAVSCSRIEKGVCDVYLPLGYEPWMRAHELRHCEGWSHP